MMPNRWRRGRTRADLPNAHLRRWARRRSTRALLRRQRRIVEEGRRRPPTVGELNLLGAIRAELRVRGVEPDRRTGRFLALLHLGIILAALARPLTGTARFSSISTQETLK